MANNGTARVLSALGGPRTRAAVASAGTLGLLARGRRGDAAVLAVTVGGAGVANTLIKKSVSRRRPWVSDAGGYSFPSGHTTGSVSLAGAAAYLSWRSTGRRPLPLAIAAMGLVLTGAIGRSRVVLGEHHPGDVLGGFVLGALWLAVVLFAANRVLGRPESR